MAEAELESVIAKRRKGGSWEIILPEVAHLRLATEGAGIPITMKISKQGSIPVRVAQPGEAVDQAGGEPVRQVQPRARRPRGEDRHLRPKTSALIVELKICDDIECLRELKMKSQVWKRYSPKALDRLREAIKSGLDVAVVWSKHRKLFTNAA